MWKCAWGVGKYEEVWKGCWGRGIVRGSVGRNVGQFGGAGKCGE